MLNNVPTIAQLAAQLKAKFTQHIETVEEGKEERGFCGVIDFAQSKWVLPATTRQGYVYVTLQRTSATAPIEALASNVTPKAGAPVIVRRTKTGFVILPDPEQMNQFSPTVNLAVGRHSHRLGLGNEDAVEGLRFEPLLCHIVSGGTSLFVKVEAGFHRYNNADVAFLGDTIDLTSYRPSTASRWCWVKVGLDQVTNTLTAMKGTDYVLSYTLTATELMAINLGVNVIPLTGVQLKNAQSAIADWRSFYDCRPFSTGMNAPSSGGDSLFLAWTGL